MTGLLKKREKYLGVNLKQYVQDLYAEKYNMLLKDTKDLNKQIDKLCSWIRRLNIIKISIVFKLIYRFNATVTKMPTKLFCRYREDYCEIYMERQRNQNS